MKTTRAVLLIASSLLFVVAMLLSPPQGYCESTNAMYPPYPAKLKFDVDTSLMFKDRNICASAIPMDNGDYLFLYSNSTGKLLFENREITFSEKDYISYCLRKGNLLDLMPSYYRYDNGDSISIGAHPKCYEALGTHIDIYTKYSSTNKTTRSSYAVISLLQSSRIRSHINSGCEMDMVSSDSVIERFYSPPVSLIPLKDNSFLLLKFNCGYYSCPFDIYKINKNTMHSMKLSENLFLIDIDQVTRLAIDHKGGKRITYQDLIDATIAYIENIN